MVEIALLCSLAIVIPWLCWLAARVRLLSRLASRATKRAPDPPRWESRLNELAADLAALSSSYEKVTGLLTRLNSRAGMREFRARSDADQVGGTVPPLGTPKSELRRYYGLNVPPVEFARRQLSLVPKE